MSNAQHVDPVIWSKKLIKSDVFGKENERNKVPKSTASISDSAHMSNAQHVDPVMLSKKLMKMMFSVRKTSTIKSQNRPHRWLTRPMLLWTLFSVSKSEQIRASSLLIWAGSIIAADKSDLVLGLYWNFSKFFNDFFLTFQGSFDEKLMTNW